MKHKYLSIIGVLLLSGCAAVPDYVSDKPISTESSIAMSQPDTINRLASVCSNVIVSLSSVDTQAAHRIMDERTSSQSALSSALKDAQQTVDYNISLSQGFKPHSSLEGRANDIENELYNIKESLETMDTAVSENNNERFQRGYETMKSGIDNLKALSTGIQ